jgi:hypothetical protein
MSNTTAICNIFYYFFCITEVPGYILFSVRKEDFGPSGGFGCVGLPYMFFIGNIFSAHLYLPLYCSIDHLNNLRPRIQSLP